MVPYYLYCFICVPVFVLLWCFVEKQLILIRTAFFCLNCTPAWHLSWYNALSQVKYDCERFSKIIFTFPLRILRVFAFIYFLLNFIFWVFSLVSIYWFCNFKKMKWIILKKSKLSSHCLPEISPFWRTPSPCEIPVYISYDFILIFAFRVVGVYLTLQVDIY